MTTQQPEALHIAYALDAVPETGADPDLIQAAAAELRRQHARIAELEAQLEAIGAGGVEPMRKLAGFDAADMATAEARGFRDGQASIALPASGQEPVAWPSNAFEVRRFIGSHFERLKFGRESGAPHDDDKYTLSAHDLLSAFRWWSESAAPQPAVAAGYALVPLEPTQAMLRAATEYSASVGVPNGKGYYIAMLAALPSAPSTEGGSNDRMAAT